MTEGILHFHTPYLLYLSDSSDPKEEVLTKLSAMYPDNTSDEILWVNEDLSSISIENIRDLIQSLSFASYQGRTRHIMLFSLEKASPPAQNALLKVLEEPPAKTQIWLTTSSSSAILPTIVSRCQEVMIVSSIKDLPSAETEILDTIAKLSHREVSEFAEKYSDREAAQKLLENLIKKAHSKLGLQTKHQTAVVQTLLQTKQYVDANVNVRLALEHGLFTIKRLSKAQD